MRTIKRLDVNNMVNNNSILASEARILQKAKERTWKDRRITDKIQTAYQYIHLVLEDESKLNNFAILSFTYDELEAGVADAVEAVLKEDGYKTKQYIDEYSPNIYLLRIAW